MSASEGALLGISALLLAYLLYALLNAEKF